MVTFALVAFLAGCGSITYTPPGGPTEASDVAQEPESTSPSAPRRTPQPSGTPEKSDTPSPSSSAGQDKTVSWRELNSDMLTARRAVNTFWREHWTDYFTGEYEAPDVVGLYDSSSGDDLPECGDEPAPADNAFYCIPDDFVAWDEVLMRRGEKLGDAWVYLIIAHEWGHAIQNRLTDESVPDTKELQADCLAAAELYGAGQDGNFTFEEGDLNEVVDALQEVADETPWTEVGDHGDATERIAWFQRGKQDGVRGCFAAR